MWMAAALAALNLAGLVAYWQWAQDGIARGHPAWLYVAAIPLVYWAVIFAFTLFYFALSWWFRAERPPAARLPLARLAPMIWGEFRALSGAAPRMIFYRWMVRDPAPAPAKRPVLLIHGVLCNAGVWNRLRRFLAGHGVAPVYTVTLSPPLASIDAFADQTAAKIDAILAATGAAQVVLVGHSMGGLVARAYLRNHGGAKVRRVITLGTPHHGSVFAWMFPGRSLEQLRPDNEWLGALPELSAGMPPITSIWSWHDSMVAPQTSSRLEGAENIALVGVGHNALLGDAHVFAVVLDEVNRSDGVGTLPHRPHGKITTQNA